MPQLFSSPTLPKPTTHPSPLYTFLFLTLLCILTLYTLQHHHHNPTLPTTHFTDLFLSSANNSTLSTYLHSLTLHPHLAGTPLATQTALLVQTHFQTLQFETHLNYHNALLSYPVHSSLSHGDSTYNLVDSPSSAGVVMPYHAYSPSGSVYGEAVFVNYGRGEDYDTLSRIGVSVKGCVAVVRRGGGLSRNAAVEIAAEKGAAAVVMFTETTAAGAEGEGFRGGVERGTVMEGLGDPLSPGWAGGERLGLGNDDVVKRFPKIPSLPVSEETAEKILGGIDDGKVPSGWRDSLKFKVGGRGGDGPTMLNFTYQGENKMATVRNVFAVIRGSEEPDRYVLLGNHRDAWTYGAVDPNSGTAALLDIARRFHLLRRSGWNPRRTIVLCSWDAEEFGMIGSTEWVEQNLVNVGSKAVAYLNVDCAVQGPGFFPSATPQLDNLLVEVTKKVKDPDSDDMTLYERWTATNKGINIQRLSGVDSDFAPFLQHAGIPSIDIYYGKDFPVYHTAFDSYSWMANHGDPLFHRHVAVAGVWGLLALRLADDPVLPLNYLPYAAQLQEYTDALSNLLGGRSSLNPIAASIKKFTVAAKAAEEQAKILREEETQGNPSVLKQRMLNDRLMLAERGFMDADGLQGRKWFKHLIYGPPRVHGSKLGFFPGIVDTVPPNRSRNAREVNAETRHEIWRVARAIQRAAYALKGELT